MNNSDSDPTNQNTLNTKALPKAIWVLGFVSLLMDISSEIVHGLLPVFLVTVLGASYTSVGLIEGFGEATALILKVLSGPLSDFMKNRKSLVLAGYFMGALSKPLFAIAQSSSFILSARMFDRMGKGIRGAPRDALIADITAPELRGKAYGLRQSLDTVGAFLGPLFAIGLMYLLHNNFRMIFWIALIPGALAVLLIIFGVHEPKHNTTKKNKWRFNDIRKFSHTFWIVCVFGALLQLARFSEAFLILRTNDLGLAVGLAPLVLVTMNIVYAVIAYPAGVLSDRVDRKIIILIGFLFLILADIAVGLGTNLYWVFSGIILWGIHLGLTQGLLSALVVDSCPTEYRGTAFGIFNLFCAMALILGSPLAGYLWDKYGAATTFLTGAAVALAGIVVLVSQKYHAHNKKYG